MKRLSLLVLGVALVGCLAGCVNTNTTKTEPTEKVEAEVNVDEAEEDVEETEEAEGEVEETVTEDEGVDISEMSLEEFNEYEAKWREESDKLWAEYEEAKESDTMFKQEDGSYKVELNGFDFNYNGDEKLQIISGPTTISMTNEDNSDYCYISVFDQADYEEGCQAVIDCEHKNTDANGNTFYYAVKKDGTSTFYVYPDDQKLIIVSYDKGNIFNFVSVVKQ